MLGSAVFRTALFVCVATVVATVVALLAAVTPASAVGSTSPGDRASRVVSVRLSGSLPVSSRGAAPSSGCRRISGTLTGYNILRDPQWRFTMRARWCWAAGRITYKHSDSGISSPGHFWRFEGWADSSSSPGRRSPWIRYRQARFAQCIPLITGADLCGHEANPWMRFSLYSNGASRIDHS
jgi:hypothetical protein